MNPRFCTFLFTPVGKSWVLIIESGLGLGGCWSFLLRHRLSPGDEYPYRGVLVDQIEP